MLLFIMLVPAFASATSVRFTHPASGSIQSLVRGDLTVTVTITGWSEPAARRLVLKVLDGYTSFMENKLFYLSEKSVTKDGVYRFTVPESVLPYDNNNYLFYTQLVPSSNYTTLEADWFKASFGNQFSDTYIRRKISISDADPSSYDTGAIKVVNRGFQWSMTTNSSTAIPVSMFTLTLDNASGTYTLNAMGTRSIVYNQSSTFDEHEDESSHDLTGEGFWLVGNTPTEYVAKNQFLAEKTYVVFVGLPWMGTYPYSPYNTLLSCPDHTMTGGPFLNDYGTGYVLLGFDSLTTDTRVYLNDIKYESDGGIDAPSHKYQYFGYISYFETYATVGGTAGSIIPGGATYTGMQGVYVYFNTLGLPWMPLLLGMLIPILLVGIVYRSMRKWEISLPNYFYALPIIAGMVIAYFIGLLLLWEFLLFAFITLFACIWRWREQIEHTVTSLRGVPFGQRNILFSKKEQAALTEAGFKRQKQLVDYGIEQQRLKRPRPSKPADKEIHGTVRTNGDITARSLLFKENGEVSKMRIQVTRKTEDEKQ